MNGGRFGLCVHVCVCVGLSMCESAYMVHLSYSLYRLWINLYKYKTTCPKGFMNLHMYQQFIRDHFPKPFPNRECFSAFANYVFPCFNLQLIDSIMGVKGYSPFVHLILWIVCSGIWSIFLFVCLSFYYVLCF